MNKAPVFLLCLGIFILSATKVVAQEKPQFEDKIKAEKEAEPLMFKFEPDYLLAREAERAQFLRLKSLIDTMNISDKRRRKLIKGLYRKKGVKRLSKILLADTRFDDEIEE